jgi:hypothetical protein
VVSLRGPPTNVCPSHELRPPPPRPFPLTTPPPLSRPLTAHLYRLPLSDTCLPLNLPPLSFTSLIPSPLSPHDMCPPPPLHVTYVMSSYPPQPITHHVSSLCLHVLSLITSYPPTTFTPQPAHTYPVACQSCPSPRPSQLHPRPPAGSLCKGPTKQQMAKERPPCLPGAKFDLGCPDPDEAVMKRGRWLEHRLPHE